jgi:CO dehydrogenase maturation factor
MSFVVAVTGKGGVGKTTVAALLISRLINRQHGPVLAVDADPNSCLDAALGVKAAKTLGGVREEAKEIAGKGLAVGVAKQQLLELKIAESLVEADGFDLIAMGRPEGPGCYCYANNVLRETLNAIAKNYPFVVIDNEAGLENLSRRIVCKADLMLLVADPSQRGLETVRRLYDLAKEMKNDYGKLGILINRIRGRPDSEFSRKRENGIDTLREHTRADFVIMLPDDPEIALLAEAGKPVSDVAEANPVVAQVDALLAKVDL